MEFVRRLGEVLYPWPVRCICCGGNTLSRHVLCPECLERLAGQQPRFGFAGDTFGISAAAHAYTGPGGALVRTLKYHAISALCREMAEDMVMAARAADIPRPDAVAHVPMHWRRRKARYFDQAELLAKEVAREWGLVPEKLLMRSRSCRSQANIEDDNVRRENVRDAFRAACDVRGRRILLIDDVYTTGATAGNCAKALMDAGALKVDILVYALSHSADGVAIPVEGARIDDLDELPF